MAKKRTKARAATKKAAKRRAPKRVTARSARAKKKTALARKRVVSAVSDAASTVLDRLRAWSPSRYSTR